MPYRVGDDQNQRANAGIKIFHSCEFSQDHPLFDLQGLEFVQVSRPEDLREYRGGVLLFDKALSRIERDIKSWKNCSRVFLAVVSEIGLEEGDFLVPEGWPANYCLKAIEAITREVGMRSGRELLNDELARERGKMLQLTNIGLALSAETHLSRLLTTILSEGRSFAQCDAASLFLVEKERTDPQELVFKLTQNDSFEIPFNETRFPMDQKSIAGFVAVTGKTLHIPDVYNLGEDQPYRFNKSFDEEVGYRSRSMLTIPMKNRGQEVIGVLQFINRKKDKTLKLKDKKTTLQNTLPFSRDLIVLLEALASQAAVAIDNSLLLRRIKRLFEGFVGAAVTAIEQRDPTTSGHSFRVADLTTELAKVLPKSGLSKFRDFHPSNDELLEIRYASLLHDFGKVGVREGVLLKKKKLPETGLEIIWHRFELRKEQLRRFALQEQVKYLEEHGLKAYQKALPQFEKHLKAELNRLDRYFDVIARANEPTILEEGNFKNLEAVVTQGPFWVGSKQIEMLTQDEFLSLSVRRGSLTPEERFEIQSHVVHTYNFLKEIPWTPELERIPEFAAAHHEKLNGTGYPSGMSAESIPLPSKLMTIADIFDALTASDRPYKRALGADAALDILLDEAKRGFIDPDLVSVFIEAKVFQVTAKGQKSHGGNQTPEGLSRNVCDYDIDTLIPH